jgi:hypothetical protein
MVRQRTLDSLAAAHADTERYLRWLQDVCFFQPPVAWRLSVVVGFYCVCVRVLTRSPADYVRRPLVPPELPMLGLGHLGLLGLRIFEATGANIADLARTLPSGSCRRSCDGH